MELATSTDTVGEHAASEAASLEATPWSRLWARVLDVQIETFVLSFVLGLLFPALFAAQVLQGRGGGLLIGLLLLPVALLLDAVIQKLFGQTLGKAVAGIRVETVGHDRLTLDLAFRRNATMYVRGMILGIPVISLIGFWKAYDDLKAGRPASWDRDLSTRVFARRHNSARTALTAVLVLAVIIGSAVLNTPAAP